MFFRKRASADLDGGIALSRDENSQVLDDLKSDIKQLQDEVAMLRRLSLASRRVDLVDWGELKIFMYTEDLAYVGVDDKYKGTPLVRERLAIPSVRPQSPAAVYDSPGADILERLFCHYWLNNLDFTYFDIGCQYGSSVIGAARFIQACGGRNAIYCFEPGVAGQLAPFNFKLNTLDIPVVLERVAVTDGDHPVILFAEYAHSENNRIINRDPASELLSYVVSGTSVDHYVAAKNISGNLILKIDTQGGEYDVLAGMVNVLAERLTTTLMEFTPAALSTRTNPAVWLERFGDYHMLDVPTFNTLEADRKPCSMIDPSQAASFVASVDQRPAKYTDILLLPKAIPNAEALLSRLTVS